MLQRGTCSWGYVSVGCNLVYFHQIRKVQTKVMSNSKGNEIVTFKPLYKLQQLIIYPSFRLGSDHSKFAVVDGHDR